MAATLGGAGFGNPSDAAEATNDWRAAAPTETRVPAMLTGGSGLPGADRVHSDELRRFYLQPPPAGGIFTGWGRSGRGASSESTSDVVLKDGGLDSGEAWMDRMERRIDEAGMGLSSASLRRRPTLVDRGLVAIFSPEPIRLGRAELGFSPYTAIKRRNPFCLLNPIPLSLSW